MFTEPESETLPLSLQAQVVDPEPLRTGAAPHLLVLGQGQGRHGQPGCPGVRAMSLDLRGTGVAWPEAAWIWAAAQGRWGQTLLTEHIQGERVTAVGAHWVPGFTLIGSCVIPCDTE